MARGLVGCWLACWGLLFVLVSTAQAYTINTTETGKRIRWSHDTVALRLQPAFERYLDDDRSREAMEMALDAWRGLPRVPELVLQPDAPAGKPGHRGASPSNGVYLLERWPYEPEKLAITVVTYEMETGRLLDADILVNGQTRFALVDERGRADATHYDLAAVLTHEVGHLLGLGESEQAADATMWPYAAPGETQKRTLADDDEDGVIESYLSSPPQPVGGCGPMTLAGRSRASSWCTVLAAACAVLARRGRKRRARAWVGWLPLSLLLLIFGFATPPSAAVSDMGEALRAIDDTEDLTARQQLTAAAKSSEPELRMQAAEVLARVGGRHDRALAEALASDADPRIAARARVAFELLLARAPRRALAAASDAGRARLGVLQGDARELVRGRALRLGTVVDNDGMYFTEYAVRAERGKETLLRVLGGARDGIGQRALHGELPPQDDQELVVATQADGTQRWAFAAGGKLFGGCLGDGPAVVGSL